MGTTYLFRVQARSAHGISDYSNVLSVLIASKPSRPDAPSTTWSDAADTVTVSWNEPETNGGPITLYQIQIRQSNGLSYSDETSYCDGSQSSIVSANQCVIPVSVLRASPFSLDWGTSVFAKISATNAKGRSSTSSAGNGAIIITYPDAPVSIVENTAVKTPTTIGIQWNEGASNGGETVDDFRINIAEQG